MNYVIEFRNMLSSLNHMPMLSSAVAEAWLKANGFEAQRRPAGTIWVHRGDAALGPRDDVQHMKGPITAQVHETTPLDQFEFNSA
jgi:hypothetical protein